MLFYSALSTPNQAPDIDGTSLRSVPYYELT